MSAAAPFTRILSPYLIEDHRGQSHPAFVKIAWNGERLSFTGVEGPKRGGNCVGSAGQTVMHDWDDATPAAGWSVDMIAQLRDLWTRWHLNDMRAECEHQRASLSDARSQVGDPCPTCGYKYGTAWLREDVPDEVLAELAAFPETEVEPAWV